MIDYDKYTDKLLKLEGRYTYDPDEIYYFNVHRPTALVRKLQKRYENFDFSLVPAVVQHALGKNLVSFDYDGSVGTGHLIIFITVEGFHEQLVLRTNFLLDIPEYYMGYEKDFVELYKKADIPSVEILFSDTSRERFPFDYQIMKLLPGKNLAPDFDGSKEAYEKIVFEMGKAYAREYQVPMQKRGWGRIKKDDGNNFIGTFDSLTSYLNAYLDHDLEVLKLFEFISPEDAEIIREFFTSKDLVSLFADTPHGFLVHNDPSDLNMRYEGDKFVALFDWENAAIYDPICEIGTAPTWSSAYPKREKLVEGFVAELGYTPANLDEKMNVYYLRKVIDKAQFALRGKRLAQKHINNFKKGVENCNLDAEVLVDV